MDLKTVMSKITPLQQLLEDINFQRTKELRNLMKDGKLDSKKHIFSTRRPIIDFSPTLFVLFLESGFVVLQGNTQWTEIFVRHFLFQNKKESIDSDDLLFFVRKKYVKGSNRHAPKVSHSSLFVCLLICETSLAHF